jgi:four helix bundle protein
MDKPHRKLEVWRLSMDTTILIYEVTKRFPDDEKYGLISQMRRAAVSIPSNIAEGAARRTAGDFGRFLTISIASLAELDTQLELAVRLKYCSEDDATRIDSMLASVSRMLIALRRSLGDDLPDKTQS